MGSSRDEAALKAPASTEVIEVTADSDGAHTADDIAPDARMSIETADEDENEKRGGMLMEDAAQGGAYEDAIDTDAQAELRSILSQSIPPTPSASSTRSRSHSFSFNRKPTPEPDLPFDFNRFQEQVRTRTAEPVAKYIRSFLHEFGRRQWNVTEQEKIVHDFLSFIGGKMRGYEPFRSMLPNEFDNALEGMEKLILNRLYPDLFPPIVLDRLGRQTAYRMGHGDDLDRDIALRLKVRAHRWISARHLDVPESGSGAGQTDERFLELAAQELNKLDDYRAPRDKVICVLNCCKVIFGLLKAKARKVTSRRPGSDTPSSRPSRVSTPTPTPGGSSNGEKADSSADSFLPLLILTLIRADSPHLNSHIGFVLRFRNPDRLSGEANYYLSSLQGAIGFIETLSREGLTCEDDEYERECEAALRKASEDDRNIGETTPTSIPPSDEGNESNDTPAETAATSGGGVTGMAAATATATANATASAAGALGNMTSAGRDLVFEKASGFLSIAGPRLGSIGRLFSNEARDSLADERRSSDINSDTRSGIRASLTPTPERARAAAPRSRRRSQSADAQRPVDMPSGSTRRTAPGHAGLNVGSPAEVDRDGGNATPRATSNSWFSNPFGSLTAPSAAANLGGAKSPPRRAADRAQNAAGTANGDDDGANLVTREEARQIRRQERRETLATLLAMFGPREVESDNSTTASDNDAAAAVEPEVSIDRDVIQAVLEEKRGRIGPAIDALLDIAAEMQQAQQAEAPAQLAQSGHEGGEHDQHDIMTMHETYADAAASKLGQHRVAKDDNAESLI